MSWCVVYRHAAARLVTSVRRCAHITPTLRQLHWLPVRQRVLFKLAILVFRCLTDQAPSYLADDCQLTSDVRPRRLIQFSDVCCAMHTEHLRRSVFCCCRTTGLEFLAGRTATMRFSQTIQTAFKDLSIRDMGPRRFVTSSKAAPYRNTLTYLLTYHVFFWDTVYVRLSVVPRGGYET